LLLRFDRARRVNDIQIWTLLLADTFVRYSVRTLEATSRVRHQVEPCEKAPLLISSSHVPFLVRPVQTPCLHNRRESHCSKQFESWRRFCCRKQSRTSTQRTRNIRHDITLLPLMLAHKCYLVFLSRVSENRMWTKPILLGCPLYVP